MSMDDGATWTASDFATDVNFAVAVQDYVTKLVQTGMDMMKLIRTLLQAALHRYISSFT